MFIIIGLGNPGPKFKNTRHNAGFLALDKFAEKNSFPDFELKKKYAAKISEGNFCGQTVLLAKPQTFMNNSGKAVKKIIDNFKIGELIENCKLKIENCIIVVHDDVDLPVGKIKISKDRGSAGHKGVESIIKAVGNENLIRIRIGIASQNDEKAEKIVLKKFIRQEQNLIDRATDKACQALDILIKNGLDEAMNQYN